MLKYILFWWLGTAVNASGWYYAVITAGAICSIIGYGVKLYKIGKESDKNSK